METKMAHEMEAGAMGLYSGFRVKAGRSREILVLDFLHNYGTRYLK